MSEDLEKDKLDSPLVVHKKSDASYEETASEIAMHETHSDDDGPTLERHRFRKTKKKKNSKGLIAIIIIVVLASVFAALYFTGNITFDKKEPSTVSTTISTTESTTNLKDEYNGTIVIKNTYIFVDGDEVNGIEGLQSTIKYDTPDPSAYKIIDENANADFLNYEVLPILEKMGFYNESTVITHIESTGLMAKDETTTKAVKKKKSQKSKTAKAASSKPASNDKND